MLNDLKASFVQFPLPSCQWLRCLLWCQWQVTAVMRLEVWSSCYCWWLRLREGLHWEVSGWHPNKNWIKTRQPTKRSENTWKYMKALWNTNTITQWKTCYLNVKIAKKTWNWSSQNLFAISTVLFWVMIVSSSRGGLEKGDKSIRSSPLQPQALLSSLDDIKSLIFGPL